MYNWKDTGKVHGTTRQLTAHHKLDTNIQTTHIEMSTMFKHEECLIPLVHKLLTPGLQSKNLD